MRVLVVLEYALVLLVGQIVIGITWALTGSVVILVRASQLFVAAWHSSRM